MDTCNICCKDVKSNLYNNCIVCKQKIFKCCFEKIVKLDNKKHIYNCPYCKGKNNVNYNDLSKKYLNDNIIKLVDNFEDILELRDMFETQYLGLREVVFDLQAKINELRLENNNLNEDNSKLYNENSNLKISVRRLTSNLRIYVKCNYKNKDNLKALGGRWDADVKLWYIEDDCENKDDILKEYMRVSIN